VETCQTLDHQARSSLRPEKKRRDRLIQRAMAHPAWALGFGDEVWWSRLAQPNQHTWTEADATYKSDTPRRAGGLMSRAASKAAGCHLPTQTA